MGKWFKLAAFAACVALSGCGHNVYMAGRTNGLTGSTVVKGGGGGGDLTITLGPRTYTGRWVYAATGGGTGFGSATTFAGSQTATTNVIAAAPDGTAGRAALSRRPACYISA